MEPLPAGCDRLRVGWQGAQCLECDAPDRCLPISESVQERIARGRVVKLPEGDRRLMSCEGRFGSEAGNCDRRRLSIAEVAQQRCDVADDPDVEREHALPQHGGFRRAGERAESAERGAGNIEGDVIDGVKKRLPRAGVARQCVERLQPLARVGTAPEADHRRCFSSSSRAAASVPGPNQRPKPASRTRKRPGARVLTHPRGLRRSEPAGRHARRAGQRVHGERAGLGGAGHGDGLRRRGRSRARGRNGRGRLPAAHPR